MHPLASRIILHRKSLAALTGQRNRHKNHPKRKDKRSRREGLTQFSAKTTSFLSQFPGRRNLDLPLAKQVVAKQGVGQRRMNGFTRIQIAKGPFYNTTCLRVGKLASGEGKFD
jgi:hypothetical protein